MKSTTILRCLFFTICCTLVANASQNDPPNNDLLSRIHLASIQEFWDNFMYANASAIVAGTKPVPNILAENSLGRVNPTFLVLNKNLTIEYIFGINAFDFNGVFGSRYYLENYQNDGDRASVKTVVQWTYPNGTVAGTIPLIGTYRFLTDVRQLDKIIEYEITALGLGYFWFSLGLNWTDPSFKDQLVGQICYIHENFCQNYPQFNDSTDCFQKLSTYALGNPNEFRMNDVMCRQIHSAMSISFPQVHCSHLAFHSMACVDRNPGEVIAPLFPGDPNRLIL